MRFSLLLVLLLCSLSGFAQEHEHFKYVAQGGDGVYSLLRRFDLHKANCNVQYFFKINDLRDDAALLKNQVYELPIEIYNFNGTSIRSTIDRDDMALALAIEKYNELMVERGLKNKGYKENLELWVPHGLLECTYFKEEEQTKPKPQAEKPPLTQGKFPIFGPKYADIENRDQALAGWVFYVVTGHGGPDPGAVAEIEGKQVSEDEYAYDISLRLARNLIAHGATAYMIVRDPNDGIRDERLLTCDDDEYCYPKSEIPLKQLSRLKQRASAINKLYYKYKKQGKKQLVLTIHIDSRSAETRIDMFFYHHPKSTRGKEVAEVLRNTIKDKYDFYNPWRGYTGEVISRDLYMLRETLPTNVYMELGNIQNPLDQDRFTIVSNRQAVADWIADGLVKLR